MKITVLGCGALGQLWLTALCKQGHEVQGWLRVPQPYCSVNLVETDGSIFNESLTANDPDFLATSDLLLVTLKAWQVSDAVKSLASTLPVTTPILLIHNGMGTIEELQNIQQPLLMGTTTHAARRDGNVIIHVANGITHIGPARQQDGDYSYLADILQTVLPDVAWHNNIRAELWRKLAVNCVINPLTAIWNCPNGELRHHPQEIMQICEEVAAVIEREGHHTSAEDLRDYVMQVIDATAENISSMLQDIDRKMERTKNRVLVKGLISPAVSLVYATLLGIAGFMLLWFGANPLACWLGVMGFVVYVGVYSLYMKRHSVYGTLIGSLSGAAPPVIGYCAVTGEFDSGAAILLAIFSLWQMPHSYAIAIFRFKDYQAANIPVLPVVKGISVAKNHITLYIIAFAVATLMLSLGGYAGYKYLVVAAAVSVWWLGMALRGYKVADDRIWARKLFGFSIIAITALSVMMSVDFMVPDSHTLLAAVW